MSKPRHRVKATSRPHLTVVPTIHHGPDEYVIMALDSMLDQAMDGSLIGIAIAGVRRDGAIATNFVTGDKLPELIGALQVVNARLIRHLEE